MPPSYHTLIKWGLSSFTTVDLTNIEAQILPIINFQIPLINQYASIEDIYQEIKILE